MRTLDDIIPPSRRRETEPLNQPAGRAPLNIAPVRPPKFPYMTLGVVALVIIISIAALLYFSVAKVEVTPLTKSVSVQTSLTASVSTGPLPFEVITAQKIATQGIQGSGMKTVTSSASGMITIYNTQAKPQKLITNTRFASTAGLIFRIHAAITVPAGSATSPGSVTAKVYADQPGSSYNVAPTSFTVPGFAGTPQASAVYARSASAFLGGASGQMPTVDPTLEKKTRDALKAALAPDLAKSIQEKVPKGYVLLIGAALTTYDDLSSAPLATTGQIEVKEQGTVTAIVFPNAALAQAIAGGAAGLGYQGEPLTLSNTRELQATPSTPVQADSTTVTFTISGTAPLLYTVDPDRIAAAIAGKSRSAAEVALTSYPEVKHAIITLRPFWRQAFPQDPASIKVIVDGL